MSTNNKPKHVDPRSAQKLEDAVHNINRIDLTCAGAAFIASFVLMLVRGKYADKATILFQDIVNIPYFSLDWLLIVSSLLTIIGICFIIKALIPIFKAL